MPAESNGEPIDGAERLPQDLREATDAFEGSELARETLGDTICDWFVANKRREWEDYRRTVYRARPNAAPQPPLMADAWIYSGDTGAGERIE